MRKGHHEVETSIDISRAPHAEPSFERRPALRQEDALPGRRVVVFYHVHAINNWECVVQDQLAKLVFSGLYRHMAACYSGVTGRTQQEVCGRAELWLRGVWGHRGHVAHISMARKGVVMVCRVVLEGPGGPSPASH